MERPEVTWSVGDIARGVVGGLFLALMVITVVTALGVTGELEIVPLVTLISASLYMSFALSLWFFAIRRRGSTLAAAGFVRVRFGTLALMPFVTIGALMLNAGIVLLVSRAIGDVPDVRDQVLPDGTGTLEAPDLLLLVAVGAVLAPLVEEFVFRGLIFRYLRARWSFFGAAAVTSAVFAVVHFSPRLIPSFFVLGFILAAVTERYRSIYPAALVHALFNGLALAVLYAEIVR